MEEVATMPSNAQEFCLRWNNFHSSLVSALDGFKNDLDFVDVTLACEGQFLKAHKMLLSACSVFFRDLLKANPCQHPIVILPPEVRFIDLEKMLRFIYQGEVNVQQEHLARFLKTAEMLKIRGLAEDGEKQRVLQAASPRPSEMSGNGSSDRCNNDGSAHSPKRPRLSLDAQSGQSTDQPQTPNDERLSGPDSDSEMIPVKQEMIELKECDFESADSEAFLAAETCYLRENSIGTTNNSSSNNNNNSSISSSSNNKSSSSTTQPPLTHPAAPPPPGPLLPSYVPPPQIKAQDDSPLPPNPDDLSQGTAARLAPDLSSSHGGGEGKEVVMWKPGQTSKSSSSSSPRIVLSYSTPSGKFQSSGNKNSPNSNPASPRVSPAGCQPQKSKVKKSPGTQRVSPAQNSSARRYSPGQNTSTRRYSPGAQRISPVQNSSTRRYSPGKQRVSPVQNSSDQKYSPSSSSISGVTGSSRSIWHPPTFSNEEEFKDFFNSPPVTPVSTQQGSKSTSPPSNSFKCDICSKSFTSKSNLNKHKKVQHSGEEYMCPICKRVFKNRYYIKDHLNLCLAPHKKHPLSAASSLQSLDDRSSVDFPDSQVDEV